MEQETAARVVLVRAVEEMLSDRIAPEALLEAHIAAGDPAEGALWIIRRANYLIDHVLGAYSEVIHRLETTLPRPWLFIGLATILGLASNYLGPSTKIHIVWNPLVILIAWNVLLYAALSIGSISHRREIPTLPTRTSSPNGRRPSNVVKHRPRLVERLVFGPAVSWLLGLKLGAEQFGQQAIDVQAVCRRFAVLWWPIARPALRVWLRQTLHLSAIGVAVGAILGMYVRGLFFAYDVIWQSTFIKDPAIVAGMLRYLLGPAAVILGQPLPGAEDVSRLVTTDGDPAAPWIHLYAVSAALFIVIPRSLLALASGGRLKRAKREIGLDLDDAYYVDLLQKARAVSPRELEAGTRNAVREECQNVCNRLVDFVCRALYDERITPRLWRFREQGGSLYDLEKELAGECQSFRQDLERELVNAEHDLERRLAERVQRLLGEEGGAFARPAEFFGELRSASSRSATHVGDQVSGHMATAVAGVVSTSVALGVGTITGGFGEALGVALLVGLVESGPVGWIIGVVAGLLATGTGFILGWQKLRQGIKAVPLPAAAVKAILWKSRYERLVANGRKRCEEAIRETLTVKLDQLSTSISEHLWNRLKVSVGEWQRPRSERTGEPD